MVDMDSDFALEVPDTPDRIRHPIEQSSGSCAEYRPPLCTRRVAKKNACHRERPEEVNADKVDTDPLPLHRRIVIKRNICHQQDLEEGIVEGISYNPLDERQNFRRAVLAQLLSKDLEANSSSSPIRGETFGVHQVEASDKNKKFGGIGLNKNPENKNFGVSQIESFDMNKKFQAFDLNKNLMVSDLQPTRDVYDNQHVPSHWNAEFCGVESSLPTISVGKARSKNGTRALNMQKEVWNEEANAESESIKNKGKGIDDRSTRTQSTPVPSVVPQRHVNQRRLVRNGCISPINIAKRITKIDIDQHACTTDLGLSHSNPQVDVSNIRDVIDLSDNSPATTEQGRLICNGLNPANDGEARAAKKVKVISHQHRPSSRRIPSSEVRLADNKKGKAIIYDDTATKSQGAKAETSSPPDFISMIVADIPDGKAETSRVHATAAEDLANFANAGNSSINSGDQGWRTTRCRNNSVIKSNNNAASAYEREHGSDSPSGLNNRVPAGERNSLSISDGANRGNLSWSSSSTSGNRRLGLNRLKRKFASTSYHPVQRSSSADDPEISYLESSRKSANTATNIADNQQRRGFVLESIVEVEDINSPEVIPSSSEDHGNGTADDSLARVRLVESDELLARRLQEEFYNESSPSVATREQLDQAIAMSLQYQENTQHISGLLARSQTVAASEAHFNAETSSQRIQQSRACVRRASRSPVLTDRRIGSSASVRMDNIRRARTVLGNNSARNVIISQLQYRDLNESDYEMLSALDENNNQHTSASERHINNLPQSVVQSNNIEECVICLETPSIGDTIRHLPCLHRFHKECIDQWLRRKNSCPVCKSGITLT